MTTTLIIARHGNTFAPGDVITRVGTTDLPLVESGLKQGQQLGTYLKAQQLIPDFIFTSTLKRTIQTAEEAQKIMGTRLKVDMLSIFNEIDYGPDENQPEEVVVQRIGSKAMMEWENQAIVPNGWNVNPLDIIQHWQAFALHLRQYYAGKVILLVTSNGIARFAPHITGDFTAFKNQYRIKISTGSFCRFENQPSDEYWTCMAWNVNPTCSETKHEHRHVKNHGNSCP